MAGTLPPLFEISDDDHGGYGAVSVYTLLALTLVVVVTRLSTRWFIGRIIHSDDILLAAAALFAIIQSILVQLAISHGLGRRASTIGESRLADYLKYEYAAQILLIVTITFSKLSLGLLFKNLMTSRRSLFANQALMGIIVAWAVASVLALALRCPMPSPWEWNRLDKCVNQTALFQAIATLNILTDVALVLLPCMMLRNVQLSRWKRCRIMALLASRLLVCIATGAEIKYTVDMLKSSDIPWKNTNSAIWDQIMMNLSIITTSLPSLGRLVIELQPSIFAFTINENPDPRSQGGTYNFTGLGKPSTENGMKPGTSVQVTSGWRESLKDDGESMEALVHDSTPQNAIQQTIHFEVH
ncbi:hypothetical protein N7462_000929 [Penicillium macrosclerotiorum]|uniref:uncharacterized protein n=1 Tax=Penicillium macrosclerotiorum TaxID=303699 RepID=UPI0025492A3E|nr:uncharacterized protein N7462_000929 [Penicillium macrosclerotiorum]KAJ5698924.1 hypothetical protein N7462_000929 [Penicillium macrosclerotiorum]